MVLGVTLSRSNETIKAAIGRWCDMAKAGNTRGVMTDYFYSTYSDEYLKKNGFMIPLLVLPDLKCPVLILGGKKDKIVSPEASLEMAEKLGCEPIMYEKYGHSAYEEASDFNKRVLEFLLK